MRARFLPFLLALFAMAPRPAAADDLDFSYVPAPGPGEKPALLLTPRRAVAYLYVEIEAGGETVTYEREDLPVGKQVRFEWKRDPRVTAATALMRVEYSDGNVEQFQVPVEYSYGGSLSVDLSRASADVSARTLNVRVDNPVDKADITAYGAGRAVLDQRTVPVSGGPGDIEVPWVGDPADVVLLDVQLYSGNTWAGFTYSPWFLDVPHEDVLFDSDQADIPATETWKLEATLRELQDVLDKYGDLVPVKLYIGGCTDTVGDGAHNRDLSLRRARSIATWLRGHGYDRPIFYHGFGESWLSVQTGDGVDNAANRRAVYLVGANPPPAGSGVPAVSWSAL